MQESWPQLSPGQNTEAGPGGTGAGVRGPADTASTQAQFQGFVLAHRQHLTHPRTAVVCEGLVLQNQGMTQGNNRLSERSPGEDPVLRV